MPMTILAAVDESTESSPVLSVANDLATAFDEELVVLHVVPTEEFEEHRESVSDTVDISGPSFDQEKDSASRFAKQVAESTLSDSDSATLSTAGRVGDPADEIVSAAETMDVRYLVIGGKRRSPTGKALFGDTTQTVLLNASVPVMTVMD